MIHDDAGYLSARKEYLWQAKRKKQRHLSLTDRTFIEQELVRGSSFTDIGKALGKVPSTIAKEIKLHMETRKACLSNATLMLT